MQSVARILPKSLSRLLLSGAVLPMLSVASAHAQGSGTPAMESVTVTGSLISRQDYNTATPIVTVDTNALKNSGQLALEQGLREMPQFSFATAGSSAFIGGSGQANVSLRGLGAQRNLVLLDGRRIMPSNSDGTVDINQLPSGIVQNIEVITGGASAVYGSDAISGVVNFKTKKAADGMTVTSSFGTTQFYGGPQWDVNAVGGMNSADGKGNITFAVEYTKRIKVQASSIPWLMASTSGVTPLVTGTWQPTADKVPNLPSQAAVNAYFAPFGAAAGKVTASSQQYGWNNDGTLFPINSITGVTSVYNLKPVLDAQGRSLLDTTGSAVGNRSYPWRGTQNPLERWSTFAKLQYALTPTVNFYGQAFYTNYNSMVESDGTVTSATQIPTVPFTNPFLQAELVRDPGFAALLASRANPTGVVSINKRFTFSGGFRDATNANNIYQMTAGVNGSLGKSITWDINATHGQTLTTYSSTGGVSLSRTQAMLNAADGGASLCAGGFNPFGNYTSSDACKNYMAPIFANRTALTQDTINAGLQGTAFTLPAGDVQYAVGAGYRRVAFSYDPDKAVQEGDPFTFNPQSKTKGASPVRELYGEALIPLLKDLPFVKSLNLDIAARNSIYKLTGMSNTYKGDIDWGIAGGLRVRAGYEKAARAPSVNELFAGNATYYANRTATTANPGGDPCDIRVSATSRALYSGICQAQGMSAATYAAYTTNDFQVPSISSGNQNLKEETSETVTMGVVYQPEFDTPWLRDASVSFDGYRIGLRDAISALDFNTLVDNCYNIISGMNPTYDPNNKYCSYLNRGTNGAMVNVRTPFANTGGLKTSGVDVQANWATDLGEITGTPDAGIFTFSTFGNYLNGYKSRIFVDSPWLQYAQTSQGTGPFPKYQASTNITWNHPSGFSLGMQWRVISDLRDAAFITSRTTTNPVSGVANYFNPSISYALPSTGTRLSVNVTNVFDRLPNQVGRNHHTTNAAVYPVMGRSFLFTLQQKL